jgi:hypothetical protein
LEKLANQNARAAAERVTMIVLDIELVPNDSPLSIIVLVFHSSENVWEQKSALSQLQSL